MSMDDLWKPILNTELSLYSVSGIEGQWKIIQNVRNIRYSDMREQTKDLAVAEDGPVL